MKYECCLRPFPYPYRAALSICSDVDETKDFETFLEIQRFLCTSQLTRFGKGVNLEIGNSIFMCSSDDTFSYTSCSSQERKKIRELIKVGYIDCLHSYGDNIKNRSDVERALGELKKYGCKIRVWTDHWTNKTNLGKDITCGRGDIVDSEIYHADLTTEFGVLFYWLGRITSIIGQGIPVSIASLLHIIRFGNLTRTLSDCLKEFCKICLGRLGYEKYSMHGKNCLMQVFQLADGKKIAEFMRCDPCVPGISKTSDFHGLSDALSQRNLKRLVKSSGYMILYTHLGRNIDLKSGMPEAAKKSLRNLANQQSEGKILVCTTFHLLRFYLVKTYLDWTTTSTNNSIDIIINGLSRFSLLQEKILESWLRGLTFYLPEDVKNARIYSRGHEIENLRENPPDFTGRRSVMIPWSPLHFPLQ